jgi:hypothetical protein
MANFLHPGDEYREQSFSSDVPNCAAKFRKRISSADISIVLETEAATSQQTSLIDRFEIFPERMVQVLSASLTALISSI